MAQRHHTIQIAYGWDDEHLHRFHIYGKHYGIAYAGGMCFSDNAHQVYLNYFEFDVGDKFTYEYKFFKHWIVDIRIEKIKPSLSLKSIIYCSQGNGMPGVYKYDELEPTINLLKAIANADETTTLSDIRPFIDELNAVKFNRRYINHRLKSELV